METAGLVALHFLWQGCLLLLLAWGLLFALRKRSAQARYVACCLTMLGMAIAPIVTASRFIEPSKPPVRYKVSIVPAQTRSEPFFSSASFTPLVSQTEGKRAPDLLAWVAIAWLAGAGLLALRALGGYVIAVHQGMKASRPTPPWLEERFLALVERMRLRKTPRLIVSSRIFAPSTIGVFKEIVFLPASLVSRLSPEMIETLLVHELAHIKRFDFIVNLFQTLVEIALFYHPAVWWLSNRIREERELCCDDVVVATLNDRKTYALALSRAEELRMPTLVLQASGANLVERIRHILGDTHMKTIASPFAIATLAVALVIGPVIHSRAVGFSEASLIKTPTAAARDAKKPWPKIEPSRVGKASKSSPMLAVDRPVRHDSGSAGNHETPRQNAGLGHLMTYSPSPADSVEPAPTLLKGETQEVYEVRTQHVRPSRLLEYINFNQPGSNGLLIEVGSKSAGGSQGADQKTNRSGGSATLTTGTGLIPASITKITPDDRRSVLILHGAGKGFIQDAEELARTVALFDIAPRSCTLEVQTVAPLDKFEGKTTGTVPNNQSWTLNQGFLGLNLSIAPRINEDNTITLFISLSQEGRGQQMVARIKHGGSIEIAFDSTSGELAAANQTSVNGVLMVGNKDEYSTVVTIKPRYAN